MGDGLSGVVVCRTGEDECMEDNGIFSDVQCIGTTLHTTVTLHTHGGALSVFV